MKEGNRKKIAIDIEEKLRFHGKFLKLEITRKVFKF